ARHGDKRAPIFVGGGVVFGPRACDYSKKVSKTTRKLALRRVLGDLIRGGVLHTLPSFVIADGKTKSFVAAVEALSTARRILIIADSFDEKTYLSARNVSHVLLMTANEVNVEQMLLHNDVFVVGAALETLAKRTA
ncbi:MAG: 50S ribosomal protein L4, partial [Verrucomicrobia bacterium]|nr:50S ribosomal protein L4 [Verrucomicrobiota bacterium]